jgi:helix-turn-helix protein
MRSSRESWAASEVASLPWAAARVVKASFELNLAQKDVWLEILSLDRGPERCWVSAPRLADRLGMGLDQLERVRRELKAYGLLLSAGSGRRGACWWVELPQEFIPTGRSPTDEVVLVLRDEFDGWLRIKQQGELTPARNGRTGPAISPPEKAGPAPPFTPGKGRTDPAISTGAASPASVADEGEVGGGASNLKRCETPLQPQVSSQEDGEQQRMERAHAREAEEGGRRRSGLATWHATVEAALGPNPRRPRVSES